MPKIELQGLSGLNGIYGLSEQDRRNKINSYIQAGLMSKNDGLRTANRLYRNRQFVDKFGEELFYKLTPEQRDYMYDRDRLLNILAVHYSPYQQRDKNGNITGVSSPTPIDNNGLDPALYERVKRFNNDTLRQFLENGDVYTRNEIQAASMKNTPEAIRKKGLDDAISALDETPAKDWKESALKGITRLGLSTLSMVDGTLNGEPIHDIEENTFNKSNQTNIERYEAQETKKIESDNAASVNQTVEAVKTKMTEDEIDSDFMSMIVPSENNPGIPVLWALFDDDGNAVRNASKAIDRDTKAEFLGKYIAMSKVLTPEQLNTYMYNEAVNFILDHESGWDKFKKTRNEVGLVASSYAASELNSFRMAAKSFYPASTVYMTPDGKVVPTKDVTFDDGKAYLNLPDRGTRIPLEEVQMQPTTLDYLGKDENGEDYSWFWNNAYWRDAERFNTWDEDEIARARRIGASPSMPLYKAGDQSSTFKEVVKMGGFAAIDGAMMLIPIAGEYAAGAKALQRLGKVGQITSKFTEYTTKFATPVGSAMGIGHSYGNNAFGENLEHNLLALSEKTWQDATDKFYKDYSENEEYKKTIDDSMLQVSQQIKADNPEITDALAMSEAQQQVMNEAISANYDALRKDPKYDYIGKTVQAHETAADAALAMYVTDAIKYGGVNFFGFRKVLFRTPKANLNSFLKSEGKGLAENEAKRLEAPKLTGKEKAKFLAKTTGWQLWGGAWTNYTDEMQMWGNRYLNNDKYKAYLDGDGNGDAFFNILSGVDSFYRGLEYAPVEESTTKAGIVGGLGGLWGTGLNFAGLTTVFADPQKRALAKYYWQKHDRNNPELETQGSPLANKTRDIPNLLAMFINNGLLNNYVGFKNSRREISRYTTLINKMLDDSNNLEAVKDLYKLNLMDFDVTDPTDEGVLNLFRTVKAFQALDNINQIDDSSNGNPTMLDMVASQSSIVREAKRILDTVDKITTPRSDKNHIDIRSEEEDATAMRESLLEEFFNANKDMTRDEDTETLALDTIISNAHDIKQTKKHIDDANKTLDKIEKKKGTKIPDAIRSKYIEAVALRNYLDRQLSTQNADISRGYSDVDYEYDENGYKQYPSEHTKFDSYDNLYYTDVDEAPHEVYGGIQGKQVYIKSLDAEIASIEKQIEENTQKLEETQRDRDYYNSKEYKKSKRSAADKEVDQAIIKKLDNELATLKVLDTYLADSKDRRVALKEKLENAVEQQKADKDFSRVLSENEIMQLDPESRARMLDPTNLRNYSSRQQKVIKNLLNWLKDRDSSNPGRIPLADLIQKQAADMRRYKAAEELINNLEEMPEAAMGYYNSALTSYNAAIITNFHHYNADALESYIRNNVDSNPLFTNKETKEGLLFAAIMNSPFDATTLRGVLQVAENQNRGTILRYRDVLNRAANSIEARTLTQSLVNKLEIGDATKEELLKNVMSIIQGCEDVTDAINKLEDAIENGSIPEAMKQNLEQVVKKLKAARSQMNSVPSETEGQAEAREASKEENRKAAEHRGNQAESEADRKNAEARQVAKALMFNYKGWADEHITIDKKTHKYYVDGKPVDYSVTEYYGELTNKEPFDPIYNFAGDLGNGFDTIGRDFFKWIFGVEGALDPSTVMYPNYPTALRDQLIKHFEEIHEQLKSLFGEHYYAITDEIPLVCSFNNNGKRNTIAGTPDMIVIDEYGKGHIIDFKIKREQNLDDWGNRDEYTFQQNGYRQMIGATFDHFQIEDARLLWAKQHYPSEGKEAKRGKKTVRYHYEVTNERTGEITVFKLREATNKEIAEDARRSDAEKQLVTIREKKKGKTKVMKFAKEPLVDGETTMGDLFEDGTWSIDKPILTDKLAQVDYLEDLKPYTGAEKLDEKPKAEPKPEVVSSIDVERTAGDRKYTGNYEVVKNPDGSYTITFEGMNEAMRAIGIKGLGTLNLTIGDLLAETDPNNNSNTQGFFVTGATISSTGEVTLQVHFSPTLETGSDRTITGNNAALIFNKLFGEDINDTVNYVRPKEITDTDNQSSKVRGRKVVEKNIKIARDENNLMNSTSDEKQKEKHILNMLTAAKLALQNGEKGDESAIGEEEKSELNQMISEAKKLGYELAEHIDVGKPYYEGLRTIAQFVEDSSLPKGSQVIRVVRKPQINKNGVMVQASEILVAQNLDEDLSMSPEHIEVGEDGGHTQSPDGEEQLKDGIDQGLDIQRANLDEDSSKAMGLADIGSVNDILTEDQIDNVYQGNIFFTYDGDVLRVDGRREVRKPDKQNDRMDTVTNWLRDNFQDAEDPSIKGVQLQEIIDTELNDIIKVEPTIRIMSVNNHTDNQHPGDRNTHIIDTPFLCVEYTDRVKNIHTKGGKNFGGVFLAETIENGEPVIKKYLLVGVCGFHKKNLSFTSWWNDGAQVERWSHVSQASADGRPAQRFFVSPNSKTQVEQIGMGWKVVRGKDGKQTFRNPSDLINDPRRNPRGIKSLADLKWGIVFYKEGLITTGLADKTVHAPKEILTNLGSTFLMIETANGDYIPTFIQPANFNSIAKGHIRSMIETELRALANKDYSEREIALENLRKLIVLQSSTMNDAENRPLDIAIGDRNNNVVKIKMGKVTVQTIDLNNVDAAEQIMEAIKNINPRINITLEALSNPVMVKHLNDAGALKTDLEMLATSNADFTVYPMDTNGNMYIPSTFKPSEPKIISESQRDAIAGYRQGHSVTFNSVLYRKENNKWVEAQSGKEITDPILLDSINKLNHILINNLEPSYQDSTGKYYIINSDAQRNEVWRYTQQNNRETIYRIDVSEGFRIIKEVAKLNAEKIAQDAAEKKLKELKEQKEAQERREQEQRPKSPTKEESRDDMIIDNSLGVFTDRVQPADKTTESNDKPIQIDISEEGAKPKTQRSNIPLSELQQRNRDFKTRWTNKSDTGVAFREKIINILVDKGAFKLGEKTAKELASNFADLKAAKIGSTVEAIMKGEVKINGKDYRFDPNVTTLDTWLEHFEKC